MKKKILVLIDNKSERKEVVKLLEKQGHEVEVEDQTDFCLRPYDNRHDLVIVDPFSLEILYVESEYRDSLVKMKGKTKRLFLSVEHEEGIKNLLSMEKGIHFDAYLNRILTSDVEIICTVNQLLSTVNEIRLN